MPHTCAKKPRNWMTIIPSLCVVMLNWMTKWLTRASNDTGDKVILSRISIRVLLMLSISLKYMTCLLSLCASQANIFIIFTALLPSPGRNMCLSLHGSICKFLVAMGDKQYNIALIQQSVLWDRSHLTGFLLLQSTQDKCR